jgi:TRAP-type mannitol/chloroaromatic compound transport system substrate-binding protein
LRGADTMAARRRIGDHTKSRTCREHEGGFMSLTSTLKSAVGALALGGALATGAAVNDASAEQIRWKMPIAFPSNLPALASPSHYVKDQLKTASNGDVQIRIYEPGKLVGALEILQAVSDGKVSAGYTWAGYDIGKVPAIPLFAATPFGMKPWAFIAWYYYGPGHDLIQEVYANKGFNVHAQLCGIIGPETAGWYRSPLNGIADFKGMKIRYAGLGGKVLQELGASVTMIPGDKLYQNLETGALDATEFSLPVIDQNLGFNEIVKNNYFPGWHQTFTAQYMLINGDAWDKATEAQKSLIETTCTAATTRALAESEYKNGKVVAEFQDKGVKARQIPDSMLKELRATTKEVLQEEAEKDEDFARVWKSQKEFMHYYKIWDKRAYMKPEMYYSQDPENGMDDGAN